MDESIEIVTKEVDSDDLKPTVPSAFAESEDDSQNGLIGSLATISCCVLQQTKDVQTNNQFQKAPITRPIV